MCRGTTAGQIVGDSQAEQEGRERLCPLLAVCGQILACSCFVVCGLLVFPCPGIPWALGTVCWKQTNSWERLHLLKHSSWLKLECLAMFLDWGWAWNKPQLSFWHNFCSFHPFLAWHFMSCQECAWAPLAEMIYCFLRSSFTSCGSSTYLLSFAVVSGQTGSAGFFYIA